MFFKQTDQQTDRPTDRHCGLALEVTLPKKVYKFNFVSRNLHKLEGTTLEVNQGDHEHNQAVKSKYFNIFIYYQKKEL